MSKLFIPENYKSRLDVYKTQKAISFIKQTFQSRLAAAMNLKRVSAPLFVTEASGLNDNLNGTERPVTFDVPAVGESVQVVHSLAKWKRLALHEYHFYVGNGLYTDMNAIRRDEDLDNIHSIYVDQWDWERVITKEQRTLDYLIETAQSIVNVICDTNELLKVDFPELTVKLNRNMFAITTSELEEMYPDLTPKEREDAITKKHGTVLLMQIGCKLKSGKP
ncbi:MAG: aspartate--ammonia ligase, partial [Clostridia bacterium]|nr:aspartate--ammonia ligase [Clostridia bacterium]